MAVKTDTLETVPTSSSMHVLALLVVFGWIWFQWRLISQAPAARISGRRTMRACYRFSGVRPPSVSASFVARVSVQRCVRCVAKPPFYPLNYGDI